MSLSERRACGRGPRMTARADGTPTIAVGGFVEAQGRRFDDPAELAAAITTPLAVGESELEGRGRRRLLDDAGDLHRRGQIEAFFAANHGARRPAGHPAGRRNTRLAP